MGTTRKHSPIPIAARFWPKVKVGKSHHECWVWQGATLAFGYGCIQRFGGGYEEAHRLSWKMAFGPIPEGLCVLHHCDNPPCVNPAHLFLGTKLDNSRDAREKGRTTRGTINRLNAGSRHGMAKLTEAEAGDILRMRRMHMPIKVIKAKYDISISTICAIGTRRIWKHL